MNILFLCTGNSCRSILAEAIFNHLAPNDWRAQSAGSQPTGFVHPHALALLASENIPTQNCRSKSWHALPMNPELVISVCSNAAAEVCPVYWGDALRAHWGVNDPAKVQGSPQKIQGAFKKTYLILRQRIETFLALDLADLKNDPLKLLHELNRIGLLFADELVVDELS
jgi:arsenate reductase